MANALACGCLRALTKFGAAIVKSRATTAIIPVNSEREKPAILALEPFAWSDWNQHPGLVGLARRAAADDPAKAWEVRLHPNAQVRCRLAGLLEGDHDWIGWLYHPLIQLPWARGIAEVAAV